MPDPFDVWCDARASADRRVAWSSLAKRELEGVPFAGARTSRSSAAELAAAWFVRPLDSFRWLVHHHFAFHLAEMPRPPVDEARHPATDAFVEGLVDVREPCFESVATRGVSDGSRVVRSDEVDVSIHDGSRDGVGVAATVIRIADRDRRVGVSIPVGVNVAYVVAEDPARLDELEALARPHLRHGDVSYADGCAPGACDRDAILAWFTQRAAVIDPAFTDAARWDARDVPGSPPGVTRVRARDGSRSIELATHGLGPPGAASTLRFDLHASGLVGARRLDASIRASTEHRWPAMVFAEVDEPVYLALTRLAPPP